MKKFLIVLLLIILAFFLIAIINKQEMKKIEIGDKIPSFSLKNQAGELVNVSAQTGKPMVIYFYPKDDTPGCTKQACKFRDEFEKFTELGVIVIGISGDSVEKHEEFAEKYKLPFTLLSDKNDEVRQLFGVPNSMLFFPGRVTYIIDKAGTVKYIFNSQFAAEKHIKVALEKLSEL